MKNICEIKFENQENLEETDNSRIGPPQHYAETTFGTKDHSLVTVAN